MFRLPSGNLTSSVVLLLRFVYEFVFIFQVSSFICGSLLCQFRRLFSGSPHIFKNNQLNE